MSLGTFTLALLATLSVRVLYRIGRLHEEGWHHLGPSRRVDVVISDRPQDDGAGALTMLLRSEGKSVTLADVRPMVALVEDTATAYELVEAARKHGVTLVGWKLDRSEQLDLIPLPGIAHLHQEPAEIFRPATNIRGKFVILEEVGPRHVVTVDAVAGGRVRRSRAEFLAYSSGVVLIVDRPARAPGGRT